MDGDRAESVYGRGFRHRHSKCVTDYRIAFTVPVIFCERRDLVCNSGTTPRDSYEKAKWLWWRDACRGRPRKCKRSDLVFQKTGTYCA